jgi:glycosyltransferase involved in cell wall biosynthesis
MHQYTADLANRMAGAGPEVHLVTTRHAPRDRYGPGITIHAPVATTDSGFSTEAIRHALSIVRGSLSAIRHVDPDLVHFTGPYLWNPLLLNSLRRAGLPTVHSLHDLHPHAGTAYGRLLYLWNGWMRHAAGHLLVHGWRYREELLAAGVEPTRVTCTLLTHLFVGHDRQQDLEQSPPVVRYEPWALLIGRLEAYKGLDVLVEAARLLELPDAGVVIAGPGQLEGLVCGEIPASVEIRNHLVGDDEAVDLFRRCGLVVLPYVEASQSALVAAAYFFRKPVIVTQAGALPEYVVDGETGWVISRDDPQALAAALESALRDPDRLARMGRAGRAWYECQRQAEFDVLQQMVASRVP